MTALAFVLAIITAFYAGYKYERLTTLIKNLQSSIKEKADKKKPTTNDSLVIDPLDEMQRARYEHEQLMKGLNPDE